MIRDRVDDEVAFSFRVMVDPKFKETVKSKLAYKLGTLLPKDKHAVTQMRKAVLNRMWQGLLKRELRILDKISLNSSSTLSKT